MPIDVSRALGASLPETEFAWDEDDVILYHLGIGAGVPPTDPQELRYTYEGDLTVLPTFAAIVPFESMIRLTEVEGIEADLAMVLHGEQDLEVHRPIRPQGRVVNRGRVSSIHDKRKGALVTVEVTTSDARTGEGIFTNRSSLYIRGEGGFGGDPGLAPGNVPPEREPDHVAESPTLPQQALIYRLSGDKNPLHADPAFAALAGYERPILHGLCSFGIVGKAVVDRALGGDPGRVTRYQARFAGVVYPGETIVTRMWEEGDRVVVAASTADRGSPVIGNAAVWTS